MDEMPEAVHGDRRVIAERWLAVAVATRVSSVLSVFFERHARQEDAFPALQMVESAWRELSGTGEETLFQRESLPLVDALQSAAAASGAAGARAAVHATEAVRSLASSGSAHGVPVVEVVAAALGVAREFDECRVRPPEGHASWLAFESAGVAAAAAKILAPVMECTAVTLFDVRLEAGAESMHYREAMRRCEEPRE